MYKRFSHTLTLLTLLLVNSCSAPKPIEWHMINVNYHNQGDAHLLVDGSMNIMVDAGEKNTAKKAVIPYLKAKCVNTIHHFFVSHPHTDHYGGIDALLDAGISIKQIYFNLPPEGIEDWNFKQHEFMATLNRAKAKGSHYKDISTDFTLALPNSKMSILYAQKNTQLKNGEKASINAYSLIMRWSVGDFRVLFTGDLDEHLGLELAGQDYIKSDILKVPHHGVTSVAPAAFFDKVDPILNMFPSSKTLWKHPRGAGVKKWVIDSKGLYCHNGLNGNIVLKFTQGAISASSDKPSKDCPNGKLNFPK